MAVLHDVLRRLLGLGVQKVHDDLVDGVLHDQAALLVQQVEVLQQPISEEVA